MRHSTRVPLRRLHIEPLEDRRLLAVGRLYVDVDAGGAGTGDTWVDAHTDLQEALALSESLNSDVDPVNDIADIWIAEGTYRPSEELDSGTARSAAFSLVEGVSLVGGFGGDETTIDERVLVDGAFQHETILSGDLGTVDDRSDNAYTVVHCASDVVAAIDGVSIIEGNASENDFGEQGSGGGIYNLGTLDVWNSTLVGNSAWDGGAGICSASGTLRVTNSTFVGNSARYGGGIENSGTLIVTHSTFRGNSGSNYGGGIYNLDGTVEVTNSTLVGNTAGYGGAIENDGTFTVANTTLSGNVASYHGGGIFNYEGPLTVTNSIVTQNEASSGSEVDGSYTNQSSFIGVDPAFVRNPSDGGDGWVDDPATTGTDESANNDYGDLRLTASSFAINLGDGSLLPADTFDLDNDLDTTEPIPVDLDGNARVFGSALDPGAFEFQGNPVGNETPSTIVTTSADVVDSTDGDISLREAIIHATLGGLSTPVTFDASLAGGEILLGGTALQLDGDVQIDASAIGGMVIDADGLSRVFSIPLGVSVDLDSLNITGGSATEGGGIYSSGFLTVRNSTLGKNSATDSGGGIFNYGTLTVINSTLIENSATDSGGGIYSGGTLMVINTNLNGNTSGYGGGGIYHDYGVLSVTNSTFSGNSAGYGGGLISWGDMATVMNSTFSANAATLSWAGGGGIASSGEIGMTNSIVAGNTAPVGNGTELHTFDGGSFTIQSSLIGVDPGFVRNPSDGGDGWADDPATTGIDESANNDYGDLRLTSSSLAVNTGNGLFVPADTLDLDDDLDTTEPIPIDLAGNPRVVGDAVDLGALEFQGSPASVETPSTVVTTLVDVVDPTDGDVSLREAITYATLGGLATPVTFDVSLADGSILLDGSELWLGADVRIDGSDVGGMVIDAGGQSRVFTTSGGASVDLVSLTITGGLAGEGGGIYCYDGTLTVTKSTLRGNVAIGNSDFGGEGGGIYSSAGTLTVTNSTLRGNVATGNSDFGGNGGGIYNRDRTLTVTNSTFVGNTAVGDNAYGGGIYNRGEATVTNSTFSGNFSSGMGGGIHNDRGVLTLNNSIVAANDATTSDPDLFDFDMESAWISGKHNLIGVGSGLGTVTNGIGGNLVGTVDVPLDPDFVRDPSDGGDGWGDNPTTTGVDESANDDYGDLHIEFRSLAWEAGNVDLIPPDLLDLDGDGDTAEPIPFDADGNPRVQAGEVNMGAYQLVFPEQFAINGHRPIDSFLPGQTEILLLFSREVTTLSPTDLTLIGPDGTVPVASVSRARQGLGWSEYALQFDPPLSSPGAYQLTVAPTVQDGFGGLLDQDLDDTPGESSDDQYVASWTGFGPRVVSHEPRGARLAFAPLAHFDMVFNTAMDQNSFALDDIQALTGPGGDIAPTGFEWLDDRTLRVTFEPITATGTVSITIGTDVRDLWGNAMDQNQNAVTGEVDDIWTGSVTRDNSGILDRDMVIPSSMGEIVIDGTVTIMPEATLTIEPGVTLKFDYDVGLTVNGGLIALGTVNQPVVFTSSAASPGSEDWMGIRVTSTGTINLDHAEVRHAWMAVDTGFETEGAVVILNKTTLRDGWYGIVVDSSLVEVTAENCLIADNVDTGVLGWGESQFSIKNCTIVGNDVGIDLDSATLTLENSIVAFNDTGLYGSGSWKTPTAIVRNSLFHNPNGSDIVWNGVLGKPNLAADGNLTVDPLFVDYDNGDFELAAGSPAVDSGTGAQASATDISDRARHDDPGMPNVGNGYPAFVDMGAYERQQDTEGADLAVTDVSHPVPEVVTVGGTFNVEWTVGNVGTVDTTGTWRDLIYLSDDPYLGGDDDVLLDSVDHTDPLAPGATYTETLTVTVPTTSGPKYILVHTQLFPISQQEPVEANNLGVSTGVLAVDVPLLELNIPFDATATQGQWDYYRFEGTPSNTVLFTLDGEAGDAALYLRQSLPPTLFDHDAAGMVAQQPDQELRLFEPVADTYYVGVFQGSTGGGSGSYTLSADPTTLFLRQVTPNEVGNADTATIKILGDAFDPSAEVQLIAPDSTIIEGEEYHQDSATLFATFDLAGATATPGSYNVVVTNPGLESFTAYDALIVVDGGQPGIRATLSMPGAARPGRVVDVRIDYTNTGTIDAVNPFLTLDSGVEDTAWSLPEDNTWVVGANFQVLQPASGMPVTILRPGQTESVVVSLRLPSRPEPVTVTLTMVGEVQDQDDIFVIMPTDPEDKFGPAGYDAPGTVDVNERHVPAGTTMEYRIEVWNEEGANAPALDVIVEDTLDPTVFDLATFEFTRVGFLEWDLPLPGGQSIDTRIDTRPDMDLAVDVQGTFDPATGRIEWWLHGMDPITGDPPEDPLAGVLPPYDPETGLEIGWFEFQVDLLPDLPSGTEILNQAYGEFNFIGDRHDNPAPSDGPWRNTLDAAGPTSQVEPLVATTRLPVFTVRWNGQDDVGGSGIAGYDIYVATDSGPSVLWLEDTTDTEALFIADPGHEYAFHAVATDNVGQREEAPAGPDAWISVTPLRLGAIGDSLSDEYTDQGFPYAQTWIELLAEDRLQDFGSIDNWGPPRRDGYENNWALAGATSQTLLDDGQHTALASQIDNGDIDYGILAIGQNDFSPGSPAYTGIYSGAWTQTQIDAYATSVVDNIALALQTLTDTGGNIVMSNIIDYGVAPLTQSFYPNPDLREQVTNVIQSINDRLLVVAGQYEVPLVDLARLSKDHLGSNHAPATSITIGGVSFDNAAGVEPNHLFVEDGIHPHTVVQAIFGVNPFLEALRLGHGEDISELAFTEQEAVELVGLTYGGTDTLDIDYANYVILPANAAGTVDMVLTRNPSTFDEPTTGEVVVLPDSEVWIDEWTSFWVEIWVGTPDSLDTGIMSAQLDLTYNTDCFTPTAIEYGPAFDVDRTGTVDDVAGVVNDLGTRTLATDVGDDRHALLARVRFEPTTNDPGLPLGADGQYLTPVDSGFSLSDAQMTRVGDVAADVTVGAPSGTELWPVMFDLSNDGRVAFEDFSLFADAFQKNVGDPTSDYVWASDFDRSGRVDFGDFSFFANNFQRTAGGVAIEYAPGFPDLWRPSPLMSSSTAPQDSAGLMPLTDESLKPILAEATYRLVRSEGPAARDVFEDVTVEIVDLPGNQLGRALDNHVWIDVNAAGHGWFLDPTPADDLEYSRQAATDELMATVGSPAEDRVDLLTTLMHELGHIFGHDHASDAGVMQDRLAPGSRSSSRADALFASFALDEDK